MWLRFFCHHLKLNAHGDCSTKMLHMEKLMEFFGTSIENSKSEALLLFYGDFAVSLSFLE